MRLHPYQEAGLEWLLSRPKAALHWEMGLGKSVTAGTALDLLMGSGESRRALIVGPIMVADGVWPDEIQKWFPGMQYVRLHEMLNAAQRTRAYYKKTGQSMPRWAAHLRADLARLPPVQIVNYENLRFLTQLYKNVGWPYDLLILDEADRIKNPEAQRTRAALWAAARSDRVIQLTGTPSPRTSEDLWSQVYALDGGAALGRTLEQFRGRWFQPHPRGYGWVPRAPLGEARRPGESSDAYERRLAEIAARQVADEIGRAIAHLAMSLKTADYLDLPERVDNYIKVDLPGPARDAYDKLEAEALLELETGVVEAANAGVLQGKLAQVASGASYLEQGRRYEVVHDAKLDALDSVLAESGGEPVIVVYGLRSELDRLLKKYPKAAVLTRDNVAEITTRWNAGEIPLLFSYPRDGLNLQAGGRSMVWFHQFWDYRLYAQMCARLHRQGQAKPVFMHHLVARNTVDEDAVDARAGKASIQDLLMERTKLRLAA